MFDLLFAAYKDLQSREDTRNGAWQQEGWDEVVYYTGEQTIQSFAKHKVIMETTKPCDWLFWVTTYRTFQSDQYLKGL